MILGISTYAIPWSIGVSGYPEPETSLDLYSFLDLAVESNLSLVQIGDNCAVDTMTPEEQIKFKSGLEQRNLSVEVGTRGTSPEHLLRYLEICGTIGAGLCRTVITHYDAMQSLDELRSVADTFQEHGVRLAVENHGLHRAEDIRRLLEMLDHPAIGSCVDTTNSFSLLEQPGQVLEILLPFAFNIHIKQFEIHRVSHQMGFELCGAPADEGLLDVAHTLAMIQRYGKMNPTVILEQWVPFIQDINTTVAVEREWFHRTVQYVKQLSVW